MATVEQIQTAIETLSPQDLSLLRRWFSERDWRLWDKQIEKDSETGKLDFLIQEALTEKTKGRLREL